MFKKLTKISLQRSVLGQWTCNRLVSPVCRELVIDWFLQYVETNLLQDHWLSTLISRLYFWDGPLPVIYQNIYQNIPNPRYHKWMKHLQNTEMVVLKLVTK